MVWQDGVHFEEAVLVIFLLVAAIGLGGFLFKDEQDKKRAISALWAGGEDSVLLRYGRFDEPSLGEGRQPTALLRRLEVVFEM